MSGTRAVLSCAALCCYLTSKLCHAHPSSPPPDGASACGHNTTTTSRSCPDDQLDKRLKYGIAAGVVCFVLLLALWLVFMYYLRKHGYICEKKSPPSSSCSSSPSPSHARGQDRQMATLDVVTLERDGKVLPSGFTNPCYEQDEPLQVTSDSTVHIKTSQSPCIT